MKVVHDRSHGVEVQAEVTRDGLTLTLPIVGPAYACQHRNDVELPPATCSKHAIEESTNFAAV